MTPLDAINGDIVRVQREFTRGTSGWFDRGGTAYLIGAAADKNPEAFAGLKGAQDTLLASLNQWKSLRAQGGKAAEGTLIVNGHKLVAAFDDLATAAKHETPGTLAGAVKGTLGVVADVATDLAAYAKTAGRAAADAAKHAGGQAFFILENLPVIAISVGAAYLFLPRLLASFMTSRRARR